MQGDPCGRAVHSVLFHLVLRLLEHLGATRSAKQLAAPVGNARSVERHLRALGCLCGPFKMHQGAFAVAARRGSTGQEHLGVQLRIGATFSR
jgi:hypothetical protein